MNCSEFQAKAEALLEANIAIRSTLRSDMQLALETHMVACKNCATDFQLAQSIRTLYRTRFHYVEPPSGTIERVHRAVEKELATLVIGKQYPSDGLDWLR